jgi:glycosyltransferase involved in cell wall biosynthesis
VIFFNRFGDYALPYMIETAEIRRVKRIVTVEHWLPSAFPDFANTRAPMLRRAINRLHYAVMMRRLDGIICISHKAREVFAREYCFPLSRMQTIHNGVNLSRFRFDVSTRSTCRRELDAGDRVVIACCGRLAQEKGVDVFLEALACIPPRELETVLAIIVGDGPLMESLREQAQRLGIQDRVRFLGHHEDVNSCLCACDIFVMPSRQEPFGLSFAEAMAVGRYVIATRVGGIPEVLSDPNLGKLIDPESPDQLADAIVGAMKDPRLREQIGRKAAEHIAAHFNVEQTVARTLEMILG